MSFMPENEKIIFHGFLEKLLIVKKNIQSHFDRYLY